MTSRKAGKRPLRVREPVLAPQAPAIAAGEFKARCLELMDEVNERRVEYIITKRGKPVAKLVPVQAQGAELAKKRKKGFGALKGSIVILGDIVGPVEEWPETYDEHNL